MGHSWGTLRTLAQDHLGWRDFVAALFVYDKKGSRYDRKQIGYSQRGESNQIVVS